MKLNAEIKEIFAVSRYSPRNLLYMHQFFKLFSGVQLKETEITKQVVSQLGATEITKQPVSQKQAPDILFRIPWGHIIQILNKCGDDREKALFYVRKTIENNWSRAVLLNFLDTNLYERQGKAVTNFALTLPKAQSDLAHIWWQ